MNDIGLQFEFAPLGLGTEIMELSRRHKLTIYDAAYLELAQHASTYRLATLDKALEAAATLGGNCAFDLDLTSACASSFPSPALGRWGPCARVYRLKLHLIMRPF